MKIEVKYMVTVLSIILIFGGLYFKFVYDVPDGEEMTNMWVSWFLVVSGIVGFVVSFLWKKRNPLETYSKDESGDSRFDMRHSDKSRNSHNRSE